MANTTELKDIIARYSEVTVDEGPVVHNWRDAVSTKYSKFPGLCALHNFIFAKNSVTGGVTIKTCPLCYTGSFSNATLHVKAGIDDIIPGNEQMFLEL